MTRNDSVVRSFARGIRAASGHLMTDGNSLWSYNLKIAVNVEGNVIVANYTSPGGAFVSQTTSCHIGLARRVASQVMHAEAFRIAFDR